MRRALKAAAFLLCLPVSVIADGIYLGARCDRLTPSASGNGVELGYLWTALPTLSAEIGAVRQSVADSRWSYLVVGGALRFAEGRDHLTLRIEAGGGETSSQSFKHRIAKLGVIHTLRPGRLIGDLGFERIEIAEVNETLARAGLQANVGGGFLVQAHWLDRISGGGDAHTWSARLDYSGLRWAWFAGLARGKATVDTLTAGTGTAPTLKTDEYFAGVTRTFGPNAVTLSLNRLEQPASRRSSLALLWRRQLDKKPGGGQ